MADTWPDGTPKRRPGYDADVWNGNKKTVEPEPARPIEVGDLVALAEPVNDRGEPTVRGVVLHVDVDTATGGQRVTIARELDRHPDQHSTAGWRYRRETHPAEAFDRRGVWHHKTSVFDRMWTNTAVARICLALGERHQLGSSWSAEDRFLLAAAAVLADLDAQDLAERRAS